MSGLDRPVWASLVHQPHWGLGGERARRFKADINRFAATPDEGVESLAALTQLVQPGDDFVYLLQVPRITVPTGLEAVKEAPGAQMVATRRLDIDEGPQLLGDADAADMLALKDVEDQLGALTLLQQQGEANARAVSAAGQALKLSDTRYRNGLVSQLELLDARRSELANKRAALQVRSAQYQATVGLIRALGGGWSEAPVKMADASTPRY